MRPPRILIVTLGGLAACSDPGTQAPGIDAPAGTTGGTFRQTCDGSAGVALDATHFLDLDDNDQGARIYTRGVDGAPVQTFELSAQLDVAAGTEVDIEDAARRDDRIYLIGSHGRNTNGALRPGRSRFAAFDVSGAVPQVQLALVGTAYQRLIVDMLVAGNWQHPDAAVIAALDASAQLGTPTDEQLAPDKLGTNIEGLSILPQGLAIGFRNPQVAGKALVVTLTNPDAVLAGATAVFGDAVLLDLGGRSIRGMAWSEAHATILVLAGPLDSNGASKLYTWSGVTAEPARFALDVPINPTGHAEAVIPYAGSRDVQVLYDQGDAELGSGACKDAQVTDKVFHDVIVHVE